MKKSYFLFLFILPFLNIFAQGTAGDGAIYEYRSLVDMQTAGILKKGFVASVTDVLPYGSVIQKLEVGVFDNISIGISYGGANIIGAGNPEWYKYPGVNIRFRLFDESLTIPAVTLGFESQGKGVYFDSSGRYAIKSPGFFASASKNFALLGYLSFHGCLNYSLENKDGDGFVNLVAGIEKTIGKNVSIITEYDFALNDNTTDLFGNGNGYLNMGLRWNMADGFTVEFDLRDLLDNKKWSPSSADRAIKFEYIKSIF